MLRPEDAGGAHQQNGVEALQSPSLGPDHPSPNTALGALPSIPAQPQPQSEALLFNPDPTRESVLQPYNSDKLANGVVSNVADLPVCLSPLEANSNDLDTLNGVHHLSPVEAVNLNPDSMNGVHQNGVHDEDKQQGVTIPGEENNPEKGKDVYTNSDYTDTVNSMGSDACLLNNSSSDENLQNLKHFLQDSKWTEEAPAAYTNQVFSKEPPSSSLDNPADPTDSESAEDSTPLISGRESADLRLESEQDESKAEEEMSLGKDSGLESLVHQLAEQHPTEVVSIIVNEVDSPQNGVKSESFQGLHKPVLGPQRKPVKNSYIHSSESLNAYKRSKQGFSNKDSLQVIAAHNWQAKTMDNIHVRKSFHNIAAASVTNLGNVFQKALSHLRTDMEYCSMMSIGHSEKKPSILTVHEAEAASDVESITSEVPVKEAGGPSIASGRHMRNLLYMSLLITIFFIASYATRNLQSSLNQDGAVGVIGLGVFWVSYILSSLVSAVMVQGIGVNRCIVGGLVLQILYVGANLYPTMWIMVPASIGGGSTLALIWNAMSTYIVMLARGESNVRQKPYERVSDRYFGIFCLIYQSNLIIGNLISALVLSHGKSPDNDSSAAAAAAAPVNVTIQNFTAAANRSSLYSGNMSHHPVTDLLGLTTTEKVLNPTNGTSSGDGGHYDICGADFCHHYEISTGAASVSKFTVFLLFGIFMLLLVVCILIAIFLLEPLKPNLFTFTTSPMKRVGQQMVRLAKFSRNRKFLLLLPLLLYSVMMYCFVSSEVTVAFMTCPIGVWMVGYSMMSYGANCSIGSYVCQALAPRIGRSFFIGLAWAITIGLLLVMRFWKPDSGSIVPVLVLTSLFGFVDGIWVVTANGVCGSVFPDHFEEAFTGLRVAQGIGGTFNFFYSPLFCMTVKLYVMMAITTAVFLGFLGAEFLIRREKRQKEAALVEKEIRITAVEEDEDEMVLEEAEKTDC